MFIYQPTYELREDYALREESITENLHFPV